MLRRGWLVSEFPPGTAPYAHHFPLRNRIIAGLSRGVLVVEAPARSGALITAGCAADEGREVAVAVAALCGVRGAGSRELAESGAVAVGSVEELLHEFGLPSGRASDSEDAGPDPSDAPAGHRATGAWLARRFGLEQERRVAVGHGSFAVADGTGLRRIGCRSSNQASQCERRTEQVEQDAGTGSP